MTGRESAADIAAAVFLAISLFAGSLVPFFLLVEAEHLTPRWVRELPHHGAGLGWSGRSDGCCSAPHPHRSEGRDLMNRIRLALHRLFRRPAVTGPYRLYVRRTPTGAMLDVEHYLIAMIETIADNPDLLDLLLEIAEDRGQAREHDGWEPDDLLVEKLTAALGYELPLYGPAVDRLASLLRSVAPVVSIPSQRVQGRAA